jgi:hypothetical protein
MSHHRSIYAPTYALLIVIAIVAAIIVGGLVLLML